jgi:hypothetical protein
MNRSELFDENLSPDIAPIDSALERLARTDRGSAPAGLADRVYRASLPALRSGQSDPVVYSFPRARAAWAGRGLAMAAGLGLAAVLGAAWLAGKSSGTVPGAAPIAMGEADWDALLALAEGPSGYEGDSLDQIEADADALARSVDDWLPDDLYTSDETAEESL